MEKYTLISSGDDGIVIHTNQTEKEICDFIEENEIEEEMFLEEDLVCPDTMEWAVGSYLLIKGEIIVPKPFKKVTKWKL